MVIEKAEFTVHNGMEESFVENFSNTVHLITATKGYRKHQLTKSIESENKYVVFVEWDSLAAHTECFMKSERFKEFVHTINPFIDTVEMEHLTQVQDI